MPRGRVAHSVLAGRRSARHAECRPDVREDHPVVELSRLENLIADPDRAAGVDRAEDLLMTRRDGVPPGVQVAADRRMRGAVAITTRLREEDRVHPSWDTSEAATLLFELISLRVRDDLVNESGLEPDRYIEIVTAAALAALAGPISDQARAQASPGYETGRSSTDTA